MKLPNGYGSVTKLSGKRRKPFLVRVTVGWDWDEENEKVIQVRHSLGTYATRAEGFHALDEYNEDPYDVKKGCTTVAQLYLAWTKEYFPTLDSESSTRTIISAWKYCSELYNMRAKDVRTRHIKKVMEEGFIVSERGKTKGKKIYASSGTKARIKSMFNLMFDFALEYEIVKTNYARNFNLSDEIIKDIETNKRGHIIFQAEERQKLWGNLYKVKFADWILIQMYMGWRPQELALIKLEEINLENWYIQSGMKTEAGKQRVVPIHSRIRELVQKNYDMAVELGSEYLINDPESRRGGPNITYDKYAPRYAKVIEVLKLNPEHRPHDPRNTFITMAKRAKVDEYAIKLMVGHKIKDITEGTYTDRDIEWMREDLEKIE